MSTVKKIEKTHVGKKIKEAASSLVTDIKGIGKDAKKATTNMLEEVGKNTKEYFQKTKQKVK